MIQNSSDSFPDKIDKFFASNKNDDLKIVALDYVKKQSWFWACFVIALALSITLFIHTGVFHGIVFSIIGTFIYFTYVYNKIRGEFMEHFAKEIGWQYEEKGDMASVSGNLFSVGHSQLIRNVVLGQFEKHSMRIFSYQYTVGSGKSAHTYYYTIFEITLNGLLPDILLKNLKNWAMFEQPKNTTKLSMEGDFNKYFSLYVANDYEIEAYQIFTPDVMTDLIDKCADLNFEFSNNKLYVYKTALITKRSEFYMMFESVKHILNHILPTILNMHDDVDALNKYYPH